jgi:N-ethylmaleimide reductase
MSILYTTINIPGIGTSKNRFCMAAMTRGFASSGHLSNEKIKEYYVKRARGGAGLILTEGVVVHESADGYNNVPHIQTRQQAESWMPTIAGVHGEGSLIVCQLWHCGRISHPDYTGGQPPQSSTSRPAEGINRQNGKPFGTPERLTREGIRKTHDLFVSAARNALEVGFDGVQLHLGHGYLADQFFDARINDRDDEYGGTSENRCRFALELIERVVGELGADKICLRISPSRDMGGIYDWPDLAEMLAYLIPKISGLGIRLLDVSCARADYYATSGRIIRMIRPAWSGLIAGGASLTKEQAESELSDHNLDLVTWGRHFIADPDLPKRFLEGIPLTPFDAAMLKELV